jgi:hypothetical protein
MKALAGSAWSAQSTPNPAQATFTHLNAVSCTSAGSCEAGGYFQVVVTSNDPTALAEAWNGSTWGLQHAVAPAGATYNALSAVSCVGSRSQRQDPAGSKPAESGTTSVPTGQ